MHILGSVRGLTAALAAAMLISAALFASAAQALPATFWGVVPQAVPSEEQWSRLKTGGVDSVRVPLDWASVQPERGGPLNWNEIDALVKRSSAAGLEILPFLTGAPTWAVPTGVVPETGGMGRAPAHLPVSGVAKAGWANLLKQAVKRYGPNGTLWAQNPTVVKRPIRNWQIWNEENFKYFVAHPNPAEYGKLVKASYTALKSADPGAQVILGGMFSRPKGGNAKHPKSYFAADFLDQMYEATPGVKTKFNGVALHPYTGSYPTLTPEIEEFRHVLAENKDPNKGLWITELGWSSMPPSNGGVNIFAKGPLGQVTQLKGAFTLLKANQVKWKLKRVYWFSVDDQADACNFCDGSGLFAPGFVPKPSWNAYVKFAGGTP
jgi:hypothetical protein